MKAEKGTAAGSGREPEPGMPRWVKVYGAVLAVSFVTYVVLKFTVFAGM